MNKLLPINDTKYELYDEESARALTVNNCVYRLTASDGAFKIGYTTEYLGDRIKKYFTKSSKERIKEHIKHSSRLKVEILHQVDDKNILVLLEQLEIMNAVGRILNENDIRPSSPKNFGNYYFKCRSVQNSLLCNKRFDHMQSLIDFKNGHYDAYFKEFPFRFSFDYVR